MRPLISITFHQGFRISKNIGHPTSGSGGKKTVKRYLKSEHTDGHTNRQTYGQIELVKESAQRANALKIICDSDHTSPPPNPPASPLFLENCDCQYVPPPLISDH